VFTVSLSVTISVWVMVFFHGLNIQMERAVVNNNIGHYQLQDSDYATISTSLSPHEFTKELKEKLKIAGVKSYSPELLMDGYLLTPEGSASLSVIGVVPHLHKNVVPISRKMSKGAYLTEYDESKVVIGEGLAKLFHLTLGDSIVMNYQDSTGELRSELLEIKGIYNFNSLGFQKKHIYVTQSTWGKLFFKTPMSGIYFNRTVLMTDGLPIDKTMESTLASTGLTLKTWMNINPEIAVVIEFQKGLTNFCFIIIATTILMTIVAPVRMLWQERVKEFNMLKIIGMSSKKAWKLATQEIYIMMAICGAFSVILITIVIGINTYTGIDFGLVKDGDHIERAGIEMPMVVYPVLIWQHVVATGLFVVMVLALSYSWSIYKTLKTVFSENETH
jgi:ABC-type lipoprotein release transport system permease subunit